ncbi:MAG: histidine--tRNA ligase, partial [Clostridia bacterium]|nr:histidine--tRNA ligase [Clostridia bacterium]
RAEKPQAGRMREFHQFGVELFGAPSPAADAEIISLANATLTELGITGYTLEINSIGCPTCRAEYHKALKAYFEGKKEQLCETCLDRLDRNPMRIIDCKVPTCQEVAKDAPRMIDYLCDDCRAHFDSVKKYLEAMDISYTVNPSIVRGLDYYTRTVFEFISSDLGAQSTICGGGRYDGLFKQLGGPDTPSLGFGMGLERVMLVMEAQGVAFPEPEKTMIYLAPMGEAATVKCMELCARLREEGFSAQTDLNNRSVKAQMKYANKLGVQYTVVIGDSELESGIVKLKNMETGEQTEVTMDSGIIQTLYDLGISDTMARLNETVETFESFMGLGALLNSKENEEE